MSLGVREFHSLSDPPVTPSIQLLTEQVLAKGLKTCQFVHFPNRRVLISYFVPNGGVIWACSLTPGAHYHLLNPYRISNL